MQRFSLVLGALFLLISLSNPLVAQNDAQTIQFDQLPATVEEFVALRDNLATTPEGGAAMFVVAMITYAQNPNLGIQFFSVVLKQELLVKTATNPNYQGLAPNHVFCLTWLEKLKQTPYLGNSYIIGTSADAGYLLPAAPYRVFFSRHVAKAEEQVKVFVLCSGADSARPISLQKDGEVWKVFEFSSLFVNMRSPKK